ncbi:MAG TPA: transposase [Kofleriaceae bacterium]|jgi:putative transposase|nr:transposase [Kofleriaceae bacterium]
MARARKRHVQQHIRYPDKNGQWRGGKRAGAGRPKSGAFASQPHKTRERLKANEPVQVTIRAVEDVGRLRHFEAYHAVRKAMVATFGRENFRIVHVSIQGTHIHLLIEADNRLALARGMQAFQISAAKHLNAAVTKQLDLPKRRRGRVFTDRYHVTIIRTPKHARHELAYVLNNWRRHGESTKRVASRWRVDPYSSGPSFDGWRDVEAREQTWPETYVPLPVWKPRTWLLREGWRKYGLIRSTEVPGPRWSPRKIS